MTQHNHIDQIRDIVLTGITGTVAGGSLAYLLDVPIQPGATMGLSAVALGWTYITMHGYLPKKPRYRTSMVLPADTGESVLVNGKQVFLRTVKWFDRREQPAVTPPMLRAFPVYHPDLEGPKVIREGQVYKYAALGWGRQLNGELYPFSGRHYVGQFDKREVACLYRLLGEVGCFNTYGQGKRSLLVVPLGRVLAITRRRYSKIG